MIEEVSVEESKTNSWYTHATYLRYVLALKNEHNLPVLELGSGPGSTPIIYNYCAKNKIRGYTIDPATEWFKKYDQYASESYRFISIADNSDAEWAKITNELLINQRYFLIFIDQGSWSARVLTAKMLKSNCEYMVFHDSDFFEMSTTKENESIRFSEVFTNSHSYNKIYPPTTICSMCKPCSFEIEA